MRIVEVHVEGFGKLHDLHVRFDPSFNVVVGRNEAGKSTLSATILGLLYGLSRADKERYRPWSGSRFSARLTYALADGTTYEVQREFERDSKGVRVYDEHGNDASGICTVGKTISPGEAHLGLSLEVITNASFLTQGDVAIDGARAERITHSLARALDGGPREDAALGAIGRLDDAITEHVGRKRATVNAPLRHLLDDIDDAYASARSMRARLRDLDDVRERLGSQRIRAAELELALRRHETRARALRAYSLHARLEALREVRDDIAVLAAERAMYDDVDNFPAHVVAELESHYLAWHTSYALARAQADEAERGRMTPALAAELEERETDGGSLGDDEFEALETTAREAGAARDRATATADRAQAARRGIDGGSELFGALFTAGGFVAIGAIVLLAFGERLIAIPVGVVAIALFALAWLRWRARRANVRAAAARQREADEAIAAEREAAATVAAVLARYHVASTDELARRRERAHELRTRKREALRLAAVATEGRRATSTAADAFDTLAGRIVAPSGSRERDLAAAKLREIRKRTRDGIDVRLSMFDVRRGDILGSDDEFALEAELAELIADGVEAVAPDEGASARAFEAERSDLQRRVGDAERSVAALEAELTVGETNIGDLAELDERTATLRARADVLERFEAAVELARATIETRTKEAHQKFARRLSDYASVAFANVTGSRYAEVRIDPTTLAVRVRSPENNAVIDVDRLSAGTREQAHLVTRLAMARMFSEGLEAAPLLLDDPFAYWDDERIARSLPILQNFARAGTQLTIFTTSAALAQAAAACGANILSQDVFESRTVSSAV